MYTVIELAKELDISEHAVRRYITRKKIEPARWAGQTRLFDKSAIEKIRVQIKPAGRPTGRQP